MTMYVTCDCDNDTFHIRFVPPLRLFAVCTECGEEREFGGDSRPDDDRGPRPRHDQPEVGDMGDL